MPDAPVRKRSVQKRSSSTICAAWIGTAIQNERHRHTSAPSASPPRIERYASAAGLSACRIANGTVCATTASGTPSAGAVPNSTNPRHRYSQPTQ